MPPAQTLRLILGDQLNHKHSWFQKPLQDVCYVLMEVGQETGYVTHHIQKVAAFFAAMRAFAGHLRSQGHQVIYLKLDDPGNRQTIKGNLKELLRKNQYARVEYQLPDEYRLDEQLRNMSRELGTACHAVDTEHFLTRREGLKELFANKKRYLMESFYRRMRKSHNILMENDKPIGGKWNFDQKNRRPYNEEVEIPPALLFENDVSSIVRTIPRQEVETLGEIEPARLSWPLSREQSLKALDYFCKNLLPSFGTYQDAMTTDQPYLFHSRLSFALNTKLLHPMEVIEAALKAWQAAPDRIGIQQIEGFLRQILGWREYMRGMYWAYMPDLAEMNHFNHQALLPNFYWTGETGMNCLAQVIGQSLRLAYAHHIQRLMITGNFALLAGVAPALVDEWYLGIYIDAIQWVELPNTRAMSQFADGGLVATKPYVSSARYINKMSNYCKTCSYDWKKRHGHKACPFNSLYWDFYERHRGLLRKNPRVGVMYRSWDRMDHAERQLTLKQAKQYKENPDNL